MFKLLFKIIKKIIIGMTLLFGYNMFLSSLNLLVPINIITIIIASILDVPGIIGLVLFLLFNY